MGCSSSSESSRRNDISRRNKSSSSSFIDISTEPHWNEEKCWVIDIIIEGGGDAEVNSNFLFQADIQVIIVLLLLLLLLLLS